MNLVTLLGLAIVAFASSNVDDIFVLVGFFADSRLRARNIVIGQYLAIGALVVVSIAASLISLFLTPAYVGLLGVLPILIGIKRLVGLRHDAKEKRPPDERHSGTLAQIAPIVVVTIANGGDNIGVYGPLFATQSTPQIAITVIVFAVMTAVWIAVARWLLNHPKVGTPIRRRGHRVIPFVLVGLGLYILYDAKSFDLWPKPSLTPSPKLTCIRAGSIAGYI
jgi:cadmium resistance protein CadD (predicted permease)